METKICEHCGQEFTQYKKTQKYCSKACSDAVRKMQTKRCITCGKEFISENVTAKYCSDECGVIYRKITKKVMDKINDHAIFLIRYGQNNPFSKPQALWIQYKETMKDLQDE